MMDLIMMRSYSVTNFGKGRNLYIVQLTYKISTKYYNPALVLPARHLQVGK